MAGSTDMARSQESALFWDVIPAGSAPTLAIVMSFASREAAHAGLTEAGFSLSDRPGRAPRLHDRSSAVIYVHGDGASVVLARRLPTEDDE